MYNLYLAKYFFSLHGNFRIGRDLSRKTNLLFHLKHDLQKDRSLQNEILICNNVMQKPIALSYVGIAVGKQVSDEIFDFTALIA